MKLVPILIAASLALPGLAAAQTRPTDTPGVAAANDRIAAGNAARQAAVGADNAAMRARDIAAYDRALARHDRTVRRDQRRYRRQQNAYADAMAAWRQQVYDCHHGHRSACRAPTPDPAAYF